MRLSRFPGRSVLVLLGMHAVLICVSAEKPVLEDLHPAGAEQGSTNVVTLGGKFDPWPPSLWIDGGGIEYSFETNKGKVQFIVGSEAAPGPRLVRIYNDEGASEPRIFVVGNGKELNEAEPNDHFLKPQSIEQLPVTMNGRLEKRGDVDSYLVRVPAGEWLEARLENYVLMGKLDAVLRLVTEHGEQLCWNHDFANLDPRLIWQAPVEQTVVLQVFGFAYPANSQIELAGGEGGSYRLHLRAANRPVSVFPDPSESEPNDEVAQAQSISVDSSIAGAIGRAGDEDRFAFEAEKDSFYLVDIKAAEMGTPLDAWLKVEDSSGKELARNDDAEGTSDPKLEWKAPDTGKFILAVGSVTHRGSDDFRYQLDLRAAAPAYRATLENSSLIIKPGETNELKLKVVFLRGFTNVLEARCDQLPSGVSVEPVNISAAGDVALKLIATPEAPPANAPFRIRLRDSVTGEELGAAFEFTSRTVNNGVPGGYQALLIESTEDIWLTVPPTPPEKPAEEPPKAAGS